VTATGYGLCFWFKLYIPSYSGRSSDVPSPMFLYDLPFCRY